MIAKKAENGFSIVEVLIVIFVVVVLAGAGYFAWQKTKKDDTTKKSTTNSQSDKQTSSKSSAKEAADPTEDGKYLYIKEWDVRVALPTDLEGKVSYQLGDKTADPDGNMLQAAKILLVSSAADNDCAVVTTPKGAFIDTGSQYIQSEAEKAFNAARYKWTFKENILKDGLYDYHLNYVTPDCASSAATVEIKQLQSVLEKLQTV